ncbi:hypothetical protein L596_012837 [Steinernema carpocapsae]|uniref:Uncharacterized protein n=1 Tax=Steinernema carpocapsae TaxID=34508 RepID=A0A4U5NYF3_STECR|nr:hypothetical protein L596_012837 [Steinernema carpocapsae]
MTRNVYMGMIIIALVTLWNMKKTRCGASNAQIPCEAVAYEDFSKIRGHAVEDEFVASVFELVGSVCDNV